MPHPSGICFDHSNNVLFVASTRNPNQIFSFTPVKDYLVRNELKGRVPKYTALVPVQADSYPGCLYLHDIAMLQGELHGAAAGLNALVSLQGLGRFKKVWWPGCIDAHGVSGFECNYLQLNSVSHADRLEDCFFSASAAEPSTRRPGHRNFPVDGRGVIFSGRTREPVVHGLTRPHSVRQHNQRLWVNNSGYGELGICEEGKFSPQVRLPGWTRGLCIRGRYAFVGTSRVIPRFRQYAPGLDVEQSRCGVHIVDLLKGVVVGSIVWPSGNQIFGVECLPVSVCQGLPFPAGLRSDLDQRKLFYTFASCTVRG